MGSSPVCTLNAQGIFRPSLADCIAYLDAGYQSIYGLDTSIASDDQDGQLLGLFASAYDDGNAMAVSTYNAFSPATAQGAGLSSVVKVNGISRNVPTRSTVPVLVVGEAYLGLDVIQNSDGSGNVWTVPALTIPSSGQIAGTATCTALGAIALSSGVTLTVMNPTRGLQSVTTTAAATPGAPVEKDAQLRLRQSKSTALPSQGRADSVEAALWQIANVQRLRIYENDTSAADTNGQPGHSIAVVIDGGDAATIAATIRAGKGICATFGSTTETIIDSIGVAHPINFFFVSEPEIAWGVSIKPGPTYSVSTGALIQKSLAAYTNALGIGVSIELLRAVQAVCLSPLITQTAAAMSAAAEAGDTAKVSTLALDLQSLSAASQTYKVEAITVGRVGGALAAADLAIAFNEAAAIPVNADGTLVTGSDVVVTLLP